MNDIPFPNPIAFLHLVRAVSVSIEQAAALYGVDPRTVRRWCWNAVVISCRIAGGSRRVSLPLCDLYVTGHRRELWDFVMEGKPPAPIVVEAFRVHGALDAMRAYVEKDGQRGHPGHRDAEQRATPAGAKIDHS
jgi:hypothetical protein